MAEVVVSDSLTGADTAPWTDTTTMVRRADAHDVATPDVRQPRAVERPARRRTRRRASPDIGGVVGDGLLAFDQAEPAPALQLLDVGRREGTTT